MTRRPVLTIGALAGVAFIALMALFRCVSPSPPESPVSSLGEPLSPLVYFPLVERSGCPTCQPCPTQTPWPTGQPTPAPTVYPTRPNQPTPRPTAAPTSPPLPGKKGVGDTYTVCEAATRTGSSWRYNWTYNPGDCPGVEDVPMLWNGAQADAVLNNPALIKGDSAFILGFNEPGGASQGNVTPHDGAVYWRRIEQVFPGKLLVSPAPSQYDIEWLDRMREEYHALYGGWPRFDRIAAHCYGPGSYCQGIIQQSIDRCNAWAGCGGVWVTEFSSMPTPGGSWVSADVIANVWRFVVWMQNNPSIERYAWFETFIWNDGQRNEWWWNGGVPSPNTPSLVDAGGNLTEIGQWYSIVHTWQDNTWLAVSGVGAAVAVGGGALWARKRRRLQV